MSIEDATRLLRQPRKHYSGSRLQMARTLIDSDFNEGAIAEADDLRAAALDIVGPAASPDQGFYPDLSPGAVVTAKSVSFGPLPPVPVLDYRLKPGNFYVGGRRFEQLETEPAIFQRAYLQMGPSTAPRANVGTYRQLAILRGWEQPVSAVEDAELVEPALGGADSVVRVRSMARVEVHEVQAASCADAFHELLGTLAERGGGTYDPATGELHSNARLQLGFANAGSEGDCDACSPSLRGRYLGSEPHTLRIMLTAPDRFVWAFDNAAPLYRVRLTLDGGGGKLEFLTPPKDSYHEPGIDTVLELLPWAVLLNQSSSAPGDTSQSTTGSEKIASRTGILAVVDEPYTSASRSLHVKLDADALSRLRAPSGKGSFDGKGVTSTTATAPGDVFATHWDSRHPQAAQLNGSDAASYLYLRVWHVKRPGAQLGISTSPARPLGATGVVPKFTGQGRAGDYWVATLRPSAPDEILPREIMLDGGTPPAGPAEFIAALSWLEWRSSGGVQHTLAAIQDCRPRFPALTQRGCCTFVVGPEGGADFSSIQAALDALPPAGGRVCVLAGTYAEALVIQGRGDVILEGCGARSRLEPNGEAESGSEPAPVLRLIGEGTLLVRELAVAARARVGIQIEGAGVRLENLTILSGPSEGQPSRSAVQVAGAEDVRITSCHIAVDPGRTDHAALYVNGTRLKIEDNVVQCKPDDNGEALAWGGLQLAGGSRDVSIRGNRIERGRGHGITLGSVRFRGRDGSALPPQGAGAGQTDPDSPLGVTGEILPIVIQTPEGDSATYFPDPDVAISELVIADNRILGMGASGIASLALGVQHDGSASRPPLCLRRTTFDVDKSNIEHNDISGNETTTVRGLPGRVLGGVVLSRAHDLRIACNSIEGNAPRSLLPSTGLHLADGRRIVVEGNRVRRNGRPSNDNPAASATPAATNGGGVVLGRVVSTVPGELDVGGLLHEVAVRDNIVDHTGGPALALFCAGASSISDNFLSCTNPQAGLFGASVNVFHGGPPAEAVGLPPGEPDAARWVQPKGSVGYLLQSSWAEFGGVTGGLRVSGNQVTTLSASPLSSWAVSVASTDDVLLVRNQFSARLPESGASVHVLVAGATANVAHNRVAENVSGVRISLFSIGTLMLTATENTTTHCSMAVCTNNEGNPAYHCVEDNLAWFAPARGPCGQTAEGLLHSVRTLVERQYPTDGVSFRHKEDSQ